MSSLLDYFSLLISRAVFYCSFEKRSMISRVEDANWTKALASGHLSDSPAVIVNAIGRLAVWR